MDYGKKKLEIEKQVLEQEGILDKSRGNLRAERLLFHLPFVTTEARKTTRPLCPAGSETKWGPTTPGLKRLPLSKWRCLVWRK